MFSSALTLKSFELRISLLIFSCSGINYAAVSCRHRIDSESKFLSLPAARCARSPSDSSSAVLAWFSAGVSACHPTSPAPRDSASLWWSHYRQMSHFPEAQSSSAPLLILARLAFFPSLERRWSFAKTFLFCFAKRKQEEKNIFWSIFNEHEWTFNWDILLRQKQKSEANRGRSVSREERNDKVSSATIAGMYRFQ